MLIFCACSEINVGITLFKFCGIKADYRRPNAGFSRLASLLRLHYSICS